MKRTEYPRPQLVREQWMNLNGTWDFLFGDEREEDGWRSIEVPFAYQAPLSGIGTNRMCDDMTYRRNVIIPEEWKGRRVRLHFGAVDYRCRVYVNDSFVGKHTGGNIGFSFDITDCLNWREETIRVEINDPCTDETIPRGKQYWLPEPDSIWYTRTSGIWQTVWLEPLDNVHIKDVKFTGDIDDGSVLMEYECSTEIPQGELRVKIFMDGQTVADHTVHGIRQEGSARFSLFGNHIFHMANHGNGWCWSPENPKLFDVELELSTDGIVRDKLESYFGLRKIETKGGRVYLNNRPYLQKLVLDQGYWPSGLLTAPTDEALKQDILLAKNLGLNGCRKHQKSEDPRFLYWADKLGYLVWEEIGACAAYTRKSAKRTVSEWTEAVHRDYNHPCIVAWVVLNESWGVPQIETNRRQQAHSMALYYHIKSLDDTRLVVNNDGWEMTKTDICAVHNYRHGSRTERGKQELFARNLATKEMLLTAEHAGRRLYAKGYGHQGEPVMLTEYGGVSFSVSGERDWGYTSVADEAEFLETYERLIRVMQNSEVLFGYCYTQLTDVEQEVNGLLTFDRKYKADPDKIRAINDSYEI